MELSDRKGQLVDYAQAYYAGKPKISNREFNILYNKYVEDGGEDLGVGFGSELGDTEHFCQPIGSLGKINQDTIKGHFDPDTIIEVTPKMDGACAVSYYNYGKLVKVVSRGTDGLVGVDITHNIAHSIPHTILQKSPTAIRGEIVLTWKDFEEIGGSHPRNKATGLSQSKHSNREEVKKLNFVAYDIITNPSGGNIPILESWRFTVCEHVEMSFEALVKSLDMEKSIFYDNHFYSILENTIPYDGLVFAVHENRSSIGSGEWDHYQSESIAYKFADESIESTIQKIRYKLSSLGRMVPVAGIDPVVLDGATISNVTLNNVEWMQARGCGIGARVSLVRANSVIPKIIETLEESDYYQMPDKCPECGGDLNMVGVHLCCTNEGCSNIESRLVMNILDEFKPKGVAGAMLDEFLDIFVISTMDDLRIMANTPQNELSSKWGSFTPHKWELLSEMVQNIANAKPGVDQILLLSGLPNFGRTSSANVLYGVTSHDFVDAIRNRSVSGWQKFCTTVVAFASLENNLDRVEQVIDFFNGNLAVLEAKTTEVSYCLTGGISKPRKQIIEEFRPYGYRFVDASKADVLIASGPSSSSKYKKAVKRGIPIMTENEFRAKYLGV
jgi:DNA ligase (NAD+)